MITEGSLFFRFTFYVLPWITYTVFLLGIIFQVRKWMSGTPDSPSDEKKSSFKVTIKALLLDLMLQRRLLRKNQGSIILWIICWLLFHIPLLFILVGHLRSVDIWSVDWFTWLASKEFLTETLPLVMGFILLSGTFLLILRRIVFKAPRSISTLDNFIVLVLIMAAVIAGSIMRSLTHSPDVFSVKIPPGFTMELEHTPSIIWLTLHALIAQIIVIYLPFSGLMHIVGGIITTMKARGE